MLELGDYYCDEKLEIEHKEFTLNKSRYELSKSKTIKFLKTLHFTEEVNTLIVNNILLYFSIYLPKYLTSFCNSKIDGELNLGINDWGIITGIPMKEKINKTIMKNHIQKIIKNQVCKLNKETLTKQELQTVESIIKIEIKELKTNQNKIQPLVNIEKMIDKYFQKKKEIQEKLKFIEKREEIWKRKHDKYRTLVKIMHKPYTSRQLYNYIRKNVNTKESQQILKNYWNICKDFKLPPHNKMQIDKRNPKHLLYWLVTFKDDMVEQLSKQKPNFSELKRRIHNQISKVEKENPIKLFYQLTTIQSQLVEKNISFYVIHIKMNTKNIPFKLMYRTPFLYDNEWKYKHRENSANGPCCI